MRRVALVLSLTLAPGAESGAADPPVEPPGATLDGASVPASGRRSAILTVGRFGRYAVTVTSAQGTGLQVVDRMAGPGPVYGSAGERDGRADLLLERGRYKVVTRGHPKASGQAKLAVRAFDEKNGPRPPLLVELKPVEASLDDFEQLSYWIDVGERRTVAIEAAGRNLADLRLWKDGSWLVDAAPVRQVVQPQVGQPLLVCRLAPTLDPGLYLLTAYGGLGQPWAEESAARPFHLRFGIPRLGVAGRTRHSVSPFGTDRFVVPHPATYFRLELPEARPTTLEVGGFDPQQPFAGGGQTAEVTKKSLPPVAETVVAQRKERDHVVAVTGSSGQPYVLQHFEMRYEYGFEGTDDEYWISTIHSGHPEDSVDSTAIVTRSGSSMPRHVEPVLAQTVELDGKTGWARRANLLDTLTVFLEVKEAGTYEILSKGTEARFRIEPFLTSRPADYKPPSKGTGSAWDLDAGYFILTVEPVKKGILDVAVRPKGLVDFMLDAVGLGRAVTARPVRPAVRFVSVSLDRDYTYTLHLNRQPEVRSGVILRRLPLDLTEPLPVAQPPGETVTLPFRAAEPGALRAEAEDGALLEVALDDGAWQKGAAVAAGDHKVAVRHAGDKTVQYALRLEPTRLQAGSPLPAMPDATLATLPDFPVLTEEEPRHFDLDRGATATFVVRAGTPALYQLQSTGLLATEGNLRARAVTSFARESQNGVGRNFLVQQYLREGDYQLTVAAQGLSTGHLGVALARTQLLEGGFLTSGLPARLSLPAGAAVAYRFVITKPGEFRLRSVGLDRGFRCRLEEGDGWPLEAPNVAADLTRWFDPGRYRLVILPQATEARLLTLIEPTPRTRRYKGHGPHSLPLARRVEHVWLEPQEGAERVPDVWEFRLPAPVDATVELTGEMQGKLLRVGDDGSTASAAFLSPARGFKGALEAGSYRLEVQSVRKNNRAPYQVALWPEQLLPGMDRDVAAPLDIPISVGQTSLVELSSFGASDVRARLEDMEGRLVAASDDRPDDWNFLIARSLSAGRYRLRVDPVGKASARCTVSMRVPREIEKPALVLPAQADVSLGRTSFLYPLTLSPGAALLLVGARSGESVGLALEAAADGAWRTIGTATGRTARLEIPLAEVAASMAGATPGASYRLRVWSLDRRDSPVHLGVAAIAPPQISEAQLAGGVELTPVAGLAPAVGAVAIELGRPGLLRVDGEGGHLRWSSARGQACQGAPGGLLVATGSVVWVVGDIPSGRPSATARAARLTLTPGQGVQLAVPLATPVVADVAPSAGPLLVLASARAAQPGVRVVNAGGPAGAGGQMAVGPRSAVAAALRAQHPSAVVWTASPTSEPPEVRVEAWSFAAPERERAPGGTLDGAVEGVRARAFALDGGAKRVHLALGNDLVAVLSSEDDVRSVHWAGGAPFAETVETDADRLTLLHTKAGEDRFSLEALPLGAGETTAALAPGAAYEGAHVRGGVLRLAVAPGSGEPATVHVRGAREEAVFVGAGGAIARGADLPLDPRGGALLVPHDPGLVLAWVDRPGAESQDLWSRERPANTSRVAPPASVTLAGALRAFRLDLPQAVMLHLRTAAPVVTLLRRGDAPPDVEVHPRGAVLDAYLPAGPSELVLRALAGGTLSGIAEITTTAVTPIGEGLGPEVLLAPGATRLFSFTVTTPGEVGIGVRASADVVESRLLSSAGRPLGSGVVQMPTLAPGTYLLALHAPEGATPVRARPAVAGVRPPDTGPPEDVIRKYLEPEGAPPSFTATRGAGPARSTEAEEGEAESFEEGTEEEAPEDGETEGSMEEEPTGSEESDDTPEEPGAGGGSW